MPFQPAYKGIPEVQSTDGDTFWTEPNLLQPKLAHVIDVIA